MNTDLQSALTRHQIPIRWHNHWQRIERKHGSAMAIKWLEYHVGEMKRMKADAGEAEEEEQRAA